MTHTELRQRTAPCPNRGRSLSIPHVLNAAVEHPDWCEWTGLIWGISLTGGVVFRCPGCWGSPRYELSTAA